MLLYISLSMLLSGRFWQAVFIVKSAEHMGNSAYLSVKAFDFLLSKNNRKAMCRSMLIL